MTACVGHYDSVAPRLLFKNEHGVMEMSDNCVHLNTECQALLESRFSGNEVCAFMAD